MTVTLKDGRVPHRSIDLCGGIPPFAQVKRLIGPCRNVWDLKDVGDIARAGAGVA